ncbi:MAG: hypothetical protein IID44_16025 [Planctomycetes bacterium]|nr:hypothetical protein [Planctomycetota bacterium]
MANSREHQGLVLSLIIFVTLSVMLSVTSYILYSRDEEAAAKVVEAQNKASGELGRADKIQGELNAVKKMLGIAEAAPHKTIEAQYRQDAITYAGVYPQDENELDYSRLATYQVAEIRAQDEQIRQLTDSLARRDVRIASLQKDHQGEIITFAEQFARIKHELQKQTTRFADQWSIYVASSDELKETFDASRATSDAESKRLGQQLTGLNDRLQQAERLVRALKNKLHAIDREATEVSDGEITNISQATGRVFLNVGRADGLRPQITFSVYPTDVVNVADLKPKAKIQVTRLLRDGHSAEARITQSDVTDPIIRGDLVFSLIWSAGQKIHFAFVGRFGFGQSDGGGKDGMRHLRELVSSTGGVVDAWSDEDGGMRGKFTVDTRYLVVGAPPLDSRLAMKSYSAAIDQARAQHVERISVEKFLDIAGRKKPRRAVTLGPGAKRPVELTDFTPRRP